MLILGDESHHNGRWPWVTAALVLANVLVFGLQVGLGERFTNGFSLVPREITEMRDIVKTEAVKIKVQEVNEYTGQVSVHDRVFYIKHYHGPFPIVLTLITSMFLHGNFFHLLGNMWFLLVFGRNVECALNHGRFLAFFILCGVIGGLAHVASDRSSVIPCMGASGAISGVLGAYVAIHPLNKIKCWFGWWFGVIELPALVVIGGWFLLQYLSAFITLEHPELGDGIAYWDHLGGFLTGITFIWGTMFYLKHQQAQAELAAADQPEPAPEPAAIVADPFGSFLPSTSIHAGSIHAGEPKPRPAADPFASFIPK
jgi:membrane associated rhomboid family serine protease